MKTCGLGVILGENYVFLGGFWVKSRFFWVVFRWKVCGFRFVLGGNWAVLAIL